jgi:hypothetical protein
MERRDGKRPERHGHVRARLGSENCDTVEPPSWWALPGAKMVLRWGRGRGGDQGGAMAQRNWTMALGFGGLHSDGRRSPPVAARSVERTVKKWNGEREGGVRCWHGLQLWACTRDMEELAGHRHHTVAWPWAGRPYCPTEILNPTESELRWLTDRAISTPHSS